MLKYRNEFKQEINLSDIISLRQRLNAVCGKDSHSTENGYVIRSLYFDNLNDKALREKINGVNKREKFRIRMYNNDDSVIFLEKKAKEKGLCLKDRVRITREETLSVLNGDYSFIADSDRKLLKEFYYKIQTQGLQPKTIVEYTREAFTFPAGTVRVTLDYNIRTGLNSTDFLNSDCIMIPAGAVNPVLEVKWDEFLPDIIRDVVQLTGRRTTAFSKYAVCRIYG